MLEQQQPAIDNSALETFDNTKLEATDLGSTNKRGVIMGTVVSDGVPQQAPELEAPPAVEQEETEEAEDEVDESEDSPFSQQFEQAFGVKPNEARELVNSLQAFRDEQTLMRSWGVDPVAYDSRMEQVKAFYQTLPEEGREKFNTVEGAQAIWTHLQETGRVQEQKPASKRTTANSRVSKQKQAPAYDFTRSEITRMPKSEYQQKLPAIVKAFQTGRVLDK